MYPAFQIRLPKQWLNNFPVARLRKTPRPASAVNAPQVDPSILYEEETLPLWTPRGFYPARIGQIVNGRYEIVAKVGYGHTSTVWLARDLYQWRWLEDRYYSLKINMLPDDLTCLPSDEVRIFRRISEADPECDSQQFIRKLVDFCTLETPAGTHDCLVFEPLRESLRTFMHRFDGRPIPPGMVKLIVRMILLGLDYLHTKCRVVHADLKPDNILMELHHKSDPDLVAQQEYQNPALQKHRKDGRIIYSSYSVLGDGTDTIKPIQITDFNFSAWGDIPHHDLIQSVPFRAPEVLLDAGFTYSADIWNLGVLIWDLIDYASLFYEVDPRHGRRYSERRHLAYITALLGEPPIDFLESGRKTHVYYDKSCRLMALIPANSSFESTLTGVPGLERAEFIAFMKRMIKWRPQDRSTARELLSDPWLYMPNPKEKE